MRYFILYALNSNRLIREYLIKGKSFDHVAQRIQRYSNGMLVTSKFALLTQNIEIAFLREVDIKFEEDYRKKDFSVINENKSYSLSELAE